MRTRMYGGVRGRGLTASSYSINFISSVTHSSHTAQDFRVHHPEDHSNVRNDQKSADEYKMKLQLFLFCTLAANQPEIQQGQWQQEEYTAQVESDSNDIHPGMPLSVDGQGNEGSGEEIQEDPCKVQSGQYATNAVEGFQTPLYAFVKKNKKFGDRNGLGKYHRDRHEKNQIPGLVVRKQGHIMRHAHEWVGSYQ
jgi:hypothetical protein